MHLEGLQLILIAPMSRADTMASALDLPDRGLLAIVGAGGKTTAMFRLARELRERGLRVACATTTRIFRPASDEAALVLAENNTRFLETCREIATLDRPACLAWAQDGDKLLGLSANFIHNLKNAQVFDWILVEADGARCLPLKAPAAHEPVIPECSTHVLGVAGLTAIGMALDERHVCRSGRYAELSGLPLGASVTPESVARVCAHPDGMFKGAPDGCTRLLWLNQADAAGAIEHGRRILDLLQEGGLLPDRAGIGAAGRTPCVMEARP